MFFQADDGVHGTELWKLVPLRTGDLDRNGQVDISDLAVQMTALSDISAYQSRQQLSDPDLLTVADVNHDGAFDNADLQALLVLLANSASITPAQARHRPARVPKASPRSHHSLRPTS